ncbi:MAG: helix-turn-helix transcriptional regulator [Desulfuromonas sp.]|nr:helix-turn-helix transcriptional regulator [Desulfuromonas sp.]
MSRQNTKPPVKTISSREAKEKLFEACAAGELTIGEATRQMRKIVGLTQKEYAEKVLKIYPRVLMDIEQGRGNPTLATLEKIARPFGLKVGFVRPGEVQRQDAGRT